MVAFIFYLPFLVVLGGTRYRQAEIDRATGGVESRVVYRVWPPVSRRFSAGEVEAIVCERVPDSDGPDGLRIRLRCRSGEEVALIKRAGWSEEVVARLREAVGDKVAVA